MLLSCSDVLKVNQDWLASVSPDLASLLDADVLDNVNLKVCVESGDMNLFFSGERVLESCNHSLSAEFFRQIQDTDGVSFPRIMRSKSDSFSSEGVLAEMVDRHQEIFLDHLPSIPAAPTDHNSAEIKARYRNLFIFGSLMLVPLLSYLRQNPDAPWISVDLIEDDLRQLVSTFSLIKLSDLVDLCSKKGIRFSLHIDPNQQNLQDRLFSQLSYSDPTLLFGLQIIRSPLRSPVLMELHSWLHAPEGASKHVGGLLGFATDEINQTQQALWNALTQQPMSVITTDQLAPEVPVIIVASGPSLDDQLGWLKDHQEGLNIVAAGSALGSLLRAGIRPDVVVFLERGGQVYFDLYDLLVEGYSIEGITACLSSTIDPRVPALFSKCVFFHRPVAAATGLFPQDQISTLPVCGPNVINAALELSLALGTREILLVGADFAAAQRSYPRSGCALGNTPRHLNIPVSGNCGRTVFSNSELLYSGYLLNRVVASTHDCRVRRMGEGSVLEAVETVSFSEQLVSTLKKSPGTLKKIISSLPKTSFNRNDCSVLFDKLESDLHDWGDLLCNSVQRSDSWSRQLADDISPLLQRSHEGDTRQRRLLSRLLCQPLFFSTMSLYDASFKDANSFGVVRQDFISSVSLMQAIISKWIDVMRRWLITEQLPSWDPGWLRHHYLKTGANS